MSENWYFTRKAGKCIAFLCEVATNIEFFLFSYLKRMIVGRKSVRQFRNKRKVDRPLQSKCSGLTLTLVVRIEQTRHLPFQSFR